jgi:hypothetical protein
VSIRQAVSGSPVRQSHVEDGDVRLQHGQPGQRRGGRASLAYYVDVGLGGKQALHAAAEDLVIIEQEHAYPALLGMLVHGRLPRFVRLPGSRR